ncbi:craniofacial development protein 2-like [Penaeus japonicus]|uniref:craniofacial development protein 2-like n=1 Tax=Penaeus japonicus TaxID=27405 RepID=UPI001C712F7D|nr:craniofacial development protein 2-like [Penaeus japonicus]
MERRKLDVLCLQETTWKGSKARDLGAGYKLYYHGENGTRNGVGVVVRGMHTNGVLEVRRITDKMMTLKLEIDGVLLNVVSAYAPQVGGGREEKEQFWEKLDEAVALIPKEERIITGADFNGHVGKGNRGDERVIGKYGYGARNDEGQAMVDFAHRTNMSVINTFYSKRESHKVTYTSGGKHTQIDYILCRRMHLKEGRDCKVIPGENVAKQHKVVIGKMRLMSRRRREGNERGKWVMAKEMVAGIAQDEVNKALKKMKRVDCGDLAMPKLKGECRQAGMGGGK